MHDDGARTRVKAMGLEVQEVNSVGHGDWPRRRERLKGTSGGAPWDAQVTDAEALIQRNSPAKSQCLHITGNL